MKKLLGFLAIFAIVMTVSLSFCCDSDPFCYADTDESSAQCLVCTPHHNTYEARNIHPVITFTISHVGQIFFEVINNYRNNFHYRLDRPPTLIS